MASTETMVNLSHHTFLDSPPLEQRITSLESQLQNLLTWQQSFTSALTVAFSANKDVHARPAPKEKVQAEARAKFPASIKEIPIRQPEVRAQEPWVTPATTPGSETPPVLQDEKPPAPESQSEALPIEPETESTKLAYKILDVIQSYGQHLKSDTDISNAGNVWAGRAMFAPKVEEHVIACQPIQMVLPSFPWKSINRIDKVTGTLPDFGEELALARLNGLCKDIADVYEHGAQVTIATDGLAFNDLVGITDEDTWAYSVALLNMATEKGFHNIKLVRIMDLLGMTNGQPITKERYLETVAECRAQLASQFGRPSEVIREMIQTDQDTLLTYRGFICFLEKDLRHSPIVKQGTSGREYRKIVKQVAEGMMIRAESFTKIIQAKCPNYVRLSIHPSKGAVKLSIPLIPQASGVFPKSPWHCSIAVGVDGSYSTVHSKDIRDTHTLVHRDGRPYFFREKSELYDWAPETVKLQHLYPSGLLVQPVPGLQEAATLEESSLAKLRQLAAIQSSVTVQGFANIADGQILPVDNRAT